MQLTLAEVEKALDIVLAHLRNADPGRYAHLEDIDAYVEWTNDGIDHPDIDDAVAAGRLDQDTADACHAVLEAGHGPIQHVLLV